MPLIRLLHLCIALLIPALLAIAVGLVMTGYLMLLGHRSPRHQVIRAMARIVGALGPSLAGLRIHCQHPERLQTTPAVYLFNHQSGLDPVIVCSLLPTDVVGVAKQPLARNPLLGPLLRLTNSIFVEKGLGWKHHLLLQAGVRLQQGFSIVIAPEGTRIRDQDGQQSRLGTFKLGAFAIAQHYQLPLTPIVIHNSGQRLPAKSTQLRPGVVNVSILDSRYVEPDEDIEKVAREMEQRYANCLLPD
jgi:putative phosphoserine phosphatase/1-acylglycerol-3-phosphate O-acyltransferase